MKQKIWAFITDLHVPFHNEKALDFVFELLEMVGITGIILGGDFLDFYSINMHGPTHPEIKETLHEEISIGKSIIKKIERKFNGVEKVFIVGNHEARLEKFIINNCAQLYGVISLESLLEINNIKWKVVPYSNVQIFRIPGIDLCVRHEPLKMGIHAAKNTVDHAKINLMFGHTHRAQSETSINLLGEVFRAYSPGWLGDMKKAPEVFSYLKNATNWTLGFSLVVIDADTQQYHVRHIDIKEYPDGSLSTELFGRIFKK